MGGIGARAPTALATCSVALAGDVPSSLLPAHPLIIPRLGSARPHGAGGDPALCQEPEQGGGRRGSLLFFFFLPL